MEIKQADGRFFTETEHGEARLLYNIKDGIMSIYHTYTPDEDRGKGIAEQLARAAFAYAMEKGLKIKPDCPYIVYFVDKNPDFKKQIV